MASPRAITPVLATLTGLVIAIGWDSGTGTVSATPAGGPVVQSGGSCPLTAAQELNSIKTFLKMMPVFRHPRCLNCHGGIPRPLPEMVRGADGVIRRGPPVRHAGVVDMDTTDDNRTCEECHVDEWGGALGAPTWTDKSDMSLCRGMHVGFPNDAAGFIDHIVRDGGHPPGFITLAFQGKRGLLDAGETIYEAETGRKITAQPPPGTHVQLIQQAKDWVAAQGGQFVGDKDCGCTVDRLEVKIQSSMTIANHGPTKETTTVTGDGAVTLKLGPDLSEPEWDVTTGPQGFDANLSWSGVTVTRSNGCQIMVLQSPPTQAKFWLGMSYRPEPKLSLQFTPGVDMHGVKARCRHPVTGAWIDVPKVDSMAQIFQAAWIALHGGPGAKPVAGLSMPGASSTQPMALDLAKLQALDPKALQAMAEAAMANPTPANVADIGKLMRQLVPNADAMVDAARTNFRFAI
ncbi:MAG TPA: hypothetical protein VLB00_03355, partial [Gemmatimonadales bacterium]|nr:hypothetical protein [Gemmatimonadales bacterium]